MFVAQPQTAQESAGAKPSEHVAETPAAIYTIVCQSRGAWVLEEGLLERTPMVASLTVLPKLWCTVESVLMRQAKEHNPGATTAVSPVGRVLRA